MERVWNYQYEGMEPGRKDCSLQAFLRSKGYPASLIASLKAEPGSVLRNGREGRMKDRLSPGDRIRVTVREKGGSENILPVDVPLDILYEDEDILVVSKPAGLPMHSAAARGEATLAGAVLYHFRQRGEEGAFRCMNRLDRDTTGVTLIAKNRLSAAILGSQIRAKADRKMIREYLAVVDGVTEESGRIIAPIGYEPGSVLKRRVDFAQGESAVTDYWRLGVFLAGGKTASFVKLILSTGRMHQIRVHMAYIGHPVLGDFLYHPDLDVFQTQALHSHRMTFIHPMTGEAMSVSAPLPKDWQENIPESLLACVSGKAGVMPMFV